MLSLSHTLISLPIAAYTENLWLIFALAFVLHLFADSLPHWNFLPDKKGRYPLLPAAFDISLGLILAWLILSHKILTPPYLVAIFGGNLPDILHAFWHFQPTSAQTRWPQPIRAMFAFHHNIQWETKKIIPGLISQIISISLAVSLL
jgi:hypothetical protein